MALKDIASMWRETAHPWF